jgi:hypothetical protein
MSQAWESFWTTKPVHVEGYLGLVVQDPPDTWVRGAYTLSPGYGWDPVPSISSPKKTDGAAKKLLEKIRGHQV